MTITLMPKVALKVTSVTDGHLWVVSHICARDPILRSSRASNSHLSSAYFINICYRHCLWRQILSCPEISDETWKLYILMDKLYVLVDSIPSPYSRTEFLNKETAMLSTFVFKHIHPLLIQLDLVHLAVLSSDVPWRPIAGGAHPWFKPNLWHIWSLWCWWWLCWRTFFKAANNFTQGMQK